MKSSSWFSLFLWLFLTAAFAHDPGLSTATVRMRPDAVEIELVLSTRDAAVLSATKETNDSTGSGALEPALAAGRLRELAADAIELSLDDHPASIEVVGCQVDLPNANAAISLRARARTFSK